MAIVRAYNVEASSCVHEKDINGICDAIDNEIVRQRKTGLKDVRARINIGDCPCGGYRWRCIVEAGSRFAKRGWFVYLIQAGKWSGWTWLGIFDNRQGEGYANAPSFYQRVI